MTVISLGTVRSCGATTLALGLAATWPSRRRVIVVEADPAGGTVAASSGWPAEPSLVSLAAAVRRADVVDLVLDHVRALPGGAPVLSAPAAGVQARRALGMLTGLLGRLGELDGDVLLDCGRLERPTQSESAGGDPLRKNQTPDTKTDRFLRADRALLATRPRLADLHAVAAFLEDTAVGELRASDRLRLVLIGDGPYPDAEVAATLGVEVAGHLPVDPASAVALTTSAASGRELRRTPLIRELRSLAASLAPSPSRSSAASRLHAAEVGHGLRAFRRFGLAAATNGAEEEEAG